MKKIFLRFMLPITLGSIALFSAIFFPIYINRVNHAGEKKNIHLNVVIPNFELSEIYDESKFDSQNMVEYWYGQKKIHKMAHASWERKYYLSTTSAYTLGDILDDINKKEKVFEFNLSKVLAGPMGRMLYGVKKTTSYLKETDNIHNTYWGIHEEKNSLNEWIKNASSNYEYISLQSPNNEYAAKNSHVHFDLNETFLAYDGRISRGVDTTYISSDDTFNLVLWQMV